MRLLFLLLSSTLLCTAHGESLVIGGRDAKKNEYPAVIDIETFVGSQSSLCTATFISENTLLTAAHCIYPYLTATSDAEIILPPGFEVKAAFISNTFRDYKKQEAQGIPGTEFLKINSDVALVVLKTTAKHASLPISTYVHTGPATIVGFGGMNLMTRTQLNRAYDNSVGIKRIGKVEIDNVSSAGRIDSQLEIFKARNWYSQKPHLALASRGDSGGPLIQNGNVVGVISGVDTSDQDDHQVYSSRTYFAGLQSPDFQEILKEARAAGSSL